MAKLTIIQKGESLPFSFDRGDESTDGYICTIFVRQFPADAAAITRVIPLTTDDNGKKVWSGFLTQTETAALSDVGIWYLTAKLVNSTTDEEEQVPTRSTPPDP